MGRRATPVMPKTEKALGQLGENIRLARLRRKLSVELVAARAGISRSTVWAIEKGAPSVSMGAYAAVLLAVGLHEDLLRVGADDPLGRTLQDLAIQPKKRAPKANQREVARDHD
jgi:transcriptional regulator with XRE-family HTH domain